MSKEKNTGPVITVTVHAPSTPDGKEFTWKKSIKVGEAADEAAEAFGLGTGYTFHNAKSEVLDRKKPLAAEGVKDGDILDLVSAGGGV